MRRINIVLRFAVCLSVITGASPLAAEAQASKTAAKNIKANLKRVNSPVRRGMRELKLQIFFTNPNHPDFQTTCGAGEFVERRIPPTKRLADAALRLLFAGPTAEEKAKGMESLEKLGAFYIGVSIRRGVAVVNFRPGAEEHLYTGGPICMQEQALTPIEKTLTKLGTIKKVGYAINGKLIEEWDAD